MNTFPPQKTNKGETLLLVDDEHAILDACSSMLKRLGYDVIVARGGKEAVDMYRQHQAQIDLVILDIIMPDLSGGEVFDRLLDINPRVKVLLSSGYSIEDQAAEIMRRGCDGFIQKPFQMEQLHRSIREIVGGQGGTGPWSRVSTRKMPPGSPEKGR